MLTGQLARVRTTKDKVIPIYLDREDPAWIEMAETLLLVFREGIGMTRGEIAAEVEELIGGGGFRTLAQQGLAKVIEDRAEFEVVADVPPDQVRDKVFSAAAAERKRLAADAKGPHQRHPFDRSVVLGAVGAELGIPPEQVAATLFADLKEENRLQAFTDVTAQRLIDRYNVALAQSVLLKSVRIEVEVRGEKPARYRQLLRWLKFRRLLFTATGSMESGYVFHIDGPLSLFSATNKYGLQVALFLPALLNCVDFRLTAEVRWGPKREPKLFVLRTGDGLLAPHAEPGTYVPAEVAAFAERFTQVAPEWSLSEATALIDLGGEGVWVPDYWAEHRPTGIGVHLEVLGFWKRSSLDRLLRLLPKHGPPRFLLAISDRLKVDEEALAEIGGPVVMFKEIPNAMEILKRLEEFVAGSRGLRLV